MNIFNSYSFDARQVFESASLRRFLAGLSSAVVAVIDSGGRAICLSSFAARSDPPSLRGMQPPQRPGQLLRVETEALDAGEQEIIDGLATPVAGAGTWHAYRCVFDCGAVDRIILRIGKDSSDSRVADVLSTIWPGLREDCLRELHRPRDLEGDEALLWMISSRLDIGVLVVSASGLILRANSAARFMMARGRVLARGHGGIHGFNDAQTRILREAIQACAIGPTNAGDQIVMLERADGGPRVPVTLSRYVHDGTPTELVTIVLPSPPDPLRVERVAREMGLTLAEARVAAMLQLGLSNREAARCMGLKEQSFSTYAKRVLSKLNVNSRAEIAQLLTWQAHGGQMQRMQGVASRGMTP